MNLNTYILIVKSDLYKTKYNIRAVNLKEASKIAKAKFARSYKVFGDKVKVSLSPDDLKNHIDEIMQALYKGDETKC